jgi:ubiquinone/menaquinone biosynthesis C-methylase UbiE
MTTQVSAAPQAQPASAGLVLDTLLAFQRSAALRAAIELGIFRAIGEGPGDVSSIARRCSASERGIRILCDYLTVIGFLNKQDGRYLHSPTSAAFLDPSSPMCIASISKFLTNAMMHDPSRELTAIVRTGTTVLPGEGSVERENPAWVEFAHCMVPMMAPMAAPLALVVLEGLSGPVRVLDIAAGHGVFGIEVGKQNPEARITGQDWAPVLEVAKANARRAGIADRYDALAGSVFEVDFNGPYDIILLTNFLHHFDEPTCVSMLRKVRAALKPGGRAAALEFVPNEDRVSPSFAACFSMTMLTTTRAGDAYTFRQLEAMYRQAGFDRVTRHPVPTGPHTVVTGHIGSNNR